jgi:hypothetical protein
MKTRITDLLLRQTLQEDAFNSSVNPQQRDPTWRTRNLFQFVQGVRWYCASVRRQILIMLVDSHCHLDFPEFAPELDAVVARAEAAGVGRMVTVCTRVRRHAQVLAVTEQFPNVTCSVGTHPHHAHEELDITADSNHEP